MSKHTIQLPSPALDGPWRADVYGAKLVPARNGKGFEELKLFEKKSMAIYSSFDSTDLRSMLRHILSWTKRQDKSLETLCLNRFGLLEVTSTPEHSYGEALELLENSVSYGEKYLELLHESRLSWSPNGKYIVGIFPFDSAELDHEELRKLMIRSVELSELTPLRPIFITENARRMLPAIQQTLSWQAFLGQDQLRYGRDRYAIEPESGMESRIPIGMAFDRTTESARTLNNLSYDPTVESLERKRSVAEDAENYRRFLEGLIDGS